MKNIFQILLLVLVLPMGYGQNWTPPVNVSNLELSSFPDMVADGNGVIHVVWYEKLESNWMKIMYSKSIDEGNTWSTPFDLSQNDDLACMMPHIVAGNDNKLYVTYDYNCGNYYQTLVHMKIFNGTAWSSTIVVSENLPASHNNILVKDHSDRVYVFWYRGYKFCVRYFENGIWSDINLPYEDQHSIDYAIADSENNLHCVGQYTYNGRAVPGIRVTYFKYLRSTEEWSDIIIVNDEDTNVGADLALDENENPHFVWNQPLTHSFPWIDGTIYCWQTAPNYFSEEKLIESQPYEEKIHISGNNVVNIFLSKGYEDSWAFRHYYKTLDSWHSCRIDSSTTYFLTGAPSVAEYNGKLYVTYFKCLDGNNCDIKFSKSDLVPGTSYRQENYKNNHSLSVFPNPFIVETSFRYTLSKEANVKLCVYDLMGNCVSTICNSFLPQGQFNFSWNGKDRNDHFVSRGLYIIQLAINGHIESQLVHYLRQH